MWQRARQRANDLDDLDDLDSINQPHNQHATTMATTRPKVLVAVSGSVATIKLSRLVEALVAFAEVRVVTTRHARHFFSDDAIDRSVPIYTDEGEWHNWHRIGDPVLHIDV